MDRRKFVLTAAGAMNAAAQTDPRSALAEEYGKLVLAVGLHDKNYVDAFYGPESWRIDVEKTKPPLEQIRDRASRAIDQLNTIGAKDADELVRLRHRYLTTQLSSLRARVDMLAGKRFKFDEESKALYDAVAPHIPESRFQSVLSKMDKLLPGTGPLAKRYDEFRRRFFIPADKLDKVFQAGIMEARKRTKAHLQLPADESFVVEYVKGQVWSAYNWYKGKSHSLIQVNTDLPVPIQNAIRLSCHEGYPGHHVYNALLEDRLVRGKGWLEYTVYPLFSPQSLIAEGSAEYGVEVAFPDADQIAFKRDVLFPLAGLDPSMAKLHHDVYLLTTELSYSHNEAARKYLDGEWSGTKTQEWLVQFALMSPEQAKQRMAFIDQNRAYVINYNLGQDLIRRFMEKRGATAKNAKKQWAEFERLLSSPRLPSDL